MKKFNTTLGELYGIRQALLEKDVINLSFSRKGGLSVARNLKKIDEELTEYIKERDELIKKYSEDGTSINPSNSNWPDFAKEFDAISSVEASFEINTITESDLPENCSPALCLAIEFMLEDPVEVVE